MSTVPVPELSIVIPVYNEDKNIELTLRALARDVKTPHVEVRKLFDLVRDDVWSASKHQQEPFTYGSPPGREDFYFVAGK